VELATFLVLSYHLISLTAETQADDHIANQGNAYKADEPNRKLLHPGQHICMPATTIAFQKLARSSLTRSARLDNTL